MMNRAKAVLIFAAFLVSLAPEAQANWFKNPFHHQSKPQTHPEHDRDKALDRQQKANAHSAKMREKQSEKHPTRKN